MGVTMKKQSLYFPEGMLEEITKEAGRQDRSMSWVIQQAWRLARGEVARLPSVNDVLSVPARPEAELPDPYLSELLKAPEEPQK